MNLADQTGNKHNVVLNTLFNFVKYIPGVSLLFVIGITAKLIASFIPNMEYVLIAILLGMLISNTISLEFGPGYPLIIQQRR